MAGQAANMGQALFSSCALLSWFFWWVFSGICSLCQVVKTMIDPVGNGHFNYLSSFSETHSISLLPWLRLEMWCGDVVQAWISLFAFPGLWPCAPGKTELGSGFNLQQCYKLKQSCFFSEYQKSSPEHIISVYLWLQGFKQVFSFPSLLKCVKDIICYNKNVNAQNKTDISSLQMPLSLEDGR